MSHHFLSAEAALETMPTVAMHAEEEQDENPSTKPGSVTKKPPMGSKNTENQKTAEGRKKINNIKKTWGIKLQHPVHQGV